MDGTVKNIFVSDAIKIHTIFAVRGWPCHTMKNPG